MKKYNQTFLFVYSLVVSLAFMATVLMAFRQAVPYRQIVKELDAEQIKIVEPDGTVRLLLSNRKNFPGTSETINGKIVTEQRPQAGMLFYNDEGAENGGLIFGGRKNARGQVIDAGGSLSFDRYAGNQEVQLIGVNDSESRFAGLSVSDSHPDTKKDPQRVWVGRDEKGNSEVALMDSTGKERLVLRVAADGQSSISFLDANGKEINKFTPANK